MASANELKLSIVLSTHLARFEAVAFKGDFENNIAKIAGWGYDGVELAIRDPDLVDVDLIERMLAKHGLQVPAIGTGQAWGEERLSFTDSDEEVRKAAIQRIKSHIQLAHRLKAKVIIGLIRGVTPPGQTKAQSMYFLEQCLQDCLEAASTQGVYLTLEPLNRYETDLIKRSGKGKQRLSDNQLRGKQKP